MLKIGRTVCWTVKSVGMFLVRAKRVRHNLALRRLSFFAKRYGRKWVNRIKQKQLKTMYQFLDKSEKEGVDCDLVKTFSNNTLISSEDREEEMLKLYGIICRVQKRIKTFLTRRRLRYAILNGRWNEIEQKYFRKTLLSTKDESDVSKYVVPLELRKIYFREYLRFLRIEYFQASAGWKEECETIKQQHSKYLAEINALNALKNEPLVRSEPTLPEKPVEKTMIPLQVGAS